LPYIKKIKVWQLIGFAYFGLIHMRNCFKIVTIKFDGHSIGEIVPLGCLQVFSPVNDNNKIKMIQNGIGEHIKNYIRNIYAILGIVISDIDGTHIWIELGDNDEIEK
jgi:hypothetical protein